MIEPENFRILVRGIDITQYNALKVFEKELIRAWENRGIKVDIVNAGADLNYVVNNHYDIGFSMNGIVFSERDYILNKYFNVPFYSYYVDHPLWMDMRIRRTNRQHCIVVDEDFKGYVDKHYRLDYKAETVMQAGVEGLHSRRPFKERKYPVVFLGSYRNCSDIMERINGERKSFATFLKHMIALGIHDPFLTIEDLYNQTLEYFKFPLEDDEEYTEFLSACGDVESYLRGYYRERAIKLLLEAGIPVEVYGEGWEQLDCNRKELLHCHAPLDYREMLDVFADAKIVINVMPWAKAGFHDRIACGMLNGALVVSDETRYMREEHLHEDKLILYSLQEIQEMPQKVAYYLEHLDEAAGIAQKGYQWARENHTWKNRAEQFLRIFQRYQDEDSKATIR